MCHSLDVWRMHANLSATHRRLLPSLNIANHGPHVGLITGAGFTAHDTAIGGGPDGPGGQTRGAMTARRSAPQVKRRDVGPGSDLVGRKQKAADPNGRKRSGRSQSGIDGRQDIPACSAVGPRVHLARNHFIPSYPAGNKYHSHSLMKPHLLAPRFQLPHKGTPRPRPSTDFTSPLTDGSVIPTKATTTTFPPPQTWPASSPPEPLPASRSTSGPT